MTSASGYCCWRRCWDWGEWQIRRRRRHSLETMGRSAEACLPLAQVMTRRSVSLLTVLRGASWRDIVVDFGLTAMGMVGHGGIFVMMARGFVLGRDSDIIRVGHEDGRQGPTSRARIVHSVIETWVKAAQTFVPACKPALWFPERRTPYLLRLHATN